MAADSDSEASSFFEQFMSSSGSGSGSFPFIMGFSSSRRRREENPDQESENPTQGRIVLINPMTQDMIVIQTGGNLEELFREGSQKEGPRPASKTSIDAMPKVVIGEGDGGDGEECSICLEGLEVGEEASEMPCKHKYHSNCIEKWLGKNGSCPVCRFKMPVDDEQDMGKKGSIGSDGGEEERERESGDEIGFQREVWVSFSFDRRRRNSRTERVAAPTSTQSADLTEASTPQDGSVVDNESSNSEAI